MKPQQKPPKDKTNIQLDITSTRKLWISIIDWTLITTLILVVLYAKISGTYIDREFYVPRGCELTSVADIQQYLNTTENDIIATYKTETGQKINITFTKTEQQKIWKNQ